MTKKIDGIVFYNYNNENNYRGRKIQVSISSNNILKSPRNLQPFEKDEKVVVKKERYYNIGSYRNNNANMIKETEEEKPMPNMLRGWSFINKDEIIYLTVEDIYNIHNVLKKNAPITEKLVTITGNLLNKSKVVKVKIGTRIADIIQDEFKIISDDYHIIINGLLSGYEILNLNSIITTNIVKKDILAKQ